MSTSQETASQSRSAGPASAMGTMIYPVVFLFFAWGFITVLNDALIPLLKELFSLTYAEVMLTQFFFFLSYFVFSMPAAIALSRVGYVHGIVIGLTVTAIGCALFAPASAIGVFPAFLAALFVIAGGITMLQVAANPFISVLGSEKSSSSRLTLAQAFNSLATMVGPLVAAKYILNRSTSASSTADAAADVHHAQLHALQFPYLAIALVLAAVALFFWLRRASDLPPAEGATTDLRSTLGVLRRPRLALGALSIFLYVGAEVSIGSVMINYLMQSSVLGIASSAASQRLAIYWGGAMVGRFIGSAILRQVSPGAVLAACAVGAGALAVASSASAGVVAAYTLLAVGLCNSIMFPTIFALALEGLGDDVPKGSGALCMAIVGGALVPPVTGLVADHWGLALALLVPAVCYVWIATYGVLCWRGLGFAGRPSHARGAIVLQTRGIPMRLFRLGLLCLGLLSPATMAADLPTAPDWTGRVTGMAYSPSYAASVEDLNAGVPEDRLRQDLTLLSGVTERIRIYSVKSTLGDVPAIAETSGLKVTVGLWLGPDRVANAAEIARGLKIILTHRRAIDRVFVGNETLLRKDLSVEELLDHIRYVKRALAGTNIAVSTGETWGFWKRYPLLAADCDFIGAHILPYWDGVRIEDAVAYVGMRLTELQQAYPGKPVVIAETGWPSAGAAHQGAVPGLAAEATFIRSFLAAAAANHYDYYLLEAFDQPWKSTTPEGAAGAHWGLFDAERHSKFSLSGALPSEGESPQ